MQPTPFNIRLLSLHREKKSISSIKAGNKRRGQEDARGGGKGRCCRWATRHFQLERRRGNYVAYNSGYLVSDNVSFLKCHPISADEDILSSLWLFSRWVMKTRIIMFQLQAASFHFEVNGNDGPTAALKRGMIQDKLPEAASDPRSGRSPSAGFSFCSSAPKRTKRRKDLFYIKQAIFLNSTIPQCDFIVNSKYYNSSNYFQSC